MGALVCPAVFGFAALMAAEKPRIDSDFYYPPLPFDLQLCMGMATHVVLTTPDGVVLESWRGDLVPGDTVKIGYRGTVPIDTIPLEYARLRVEHPFGEWYLPGCLTLKSDRGKKPAVLDRDPGRRLLLFLRKVHDDELGELWWPAAFRYRPFKKGDFRPCFGYPMPPEFWELRPWEEVSSTSSALLVEDGVAFGLAREASGQLQMAVVSRNLPGFRVHIDSVFVNDIRNSYREELIFKSCDSYCEKPAFDLKNCVARATDIVVVNEVGRVTDVWKGDTKPGEVIPVKPQASSQRVLFLVKPPEIPSDCIFPSNAQIPRRLVVERDLLGYESTYFWPKPYIPVRGHWRGLWGEEEPVFPTQVLDTRSFFTQPSSGWLPASESGGFDFSMAYIDQFGWVYTKQRVLVFRCGSSFGPPPCEYQWLPLTTEDSFRQQVFDMVERMRGEAAGIEAQSNNIVASRWDFR